MGARQQPQGGPVRLSAYARALGFTHAFNFGPGAANATNIVNSSVGMSLVSGATVTGGPGGRAVQFTGALGDRLEVSGNPFATSTCTYLWLDSGIDATSNGQAVTSSRYGNTNLLEQFGLQIRVQGTAVNILAAQLALKFGANNARDNTGRLNVTAVSVAGDNGRHAVFSAGRLIAAGTPGNTSNYQFGISAIGGAFDVTSSTVKYYSLLFAPKVIPDDALRYLTANPWAMYDDDEDEFFSVASVNSASLAWVEGNDTMAAAGIVTDRGSLSWTEQNESASLLGSVSSPAPDGTTATMAWTEAGDTAAVAARLTNRAALGFTETGDTWTLGVTPTLPPGTPPPNYYLATIMRQSTVNLTADLGPAIINLTSGFP